MDDGDKSQLEDLLKARAADLRGGRRVRAPRDTAPRGGTPTRMEAPPALAKCTGCGGEISALRLRAMPDAQRCLECQRSTELAPAQT